jgi:hypothetical protein
VVEQGTHKPLVGGSNPPSATTLSGEGAAAAAAAASAMFLTKSNATRFASRGLAQPNRGSISVLPDLGRARVGRVRLCRMIRPVYAVRGRSTTRSAAILRPGRSCRTVDCSIPAQPAKMPEMIRSRRFGEAAGGGNARAIQGAVLVVRMNDTAGQAGRRVHEKPGVILAARLVQSHLPLVPRRLS